MQADCIQYLQQKLHGNSVTIRSTETPDTSGLFQVEVRCKTNHWKLYIEDEYGLFGKYNSVTDFFLVLHHLRVYRESKDFLDWCMYYNLPPAATHWLAYFRTLSATYREMEQALGDLDPCISAFDVELDAGDFQALLKAL